MARNRTVVRRSFQGSRSPGRLTEWFAGVPAEVALAGSAFTFTSLNAAGLAKRPFTITRTVGLLSIQSDQNAAAEFPFGAMGMMVVSDKAVATGATAIPDPITEQASDMWFMYQAFSAEGTISSNAGRPIMQFPFDSRAQRKVQQGEDVVVVWANGSVDGLNFVSNFRQLVKLS